MFSHIFFPKRNVLEINLKKKFNYQFITLFFFSLKKLFLEWNSSYNSYMFL